MPTMRSPAISATPKRSASGTSLSRMCGARGCWRKRSAAAADVALDDVVAQDDADLLAVGEVLGQRQGVGDAAFAFLVGVVDVLQAELFAVGQQAQEIARVAAAGDDQDVLDPGVHQRLDGIVDHRLVIDRQQMLVGDFGEREQTASRTSGQHDTFHRLSSYQRRPTLIEYAAWNSTTGNNCRRNR